MKTLVSGNIPNIQQQQATLDPYSILDRNLKQFQNKIRNKEKTLREYYKVSPDEFSKYVANFQKEYDAYKSKIISTRLQLDDLKFGIDTGKIDPVAGEQAMMQLVLPEEIYKTLYPKQQAQQRGRFTPNEYNSYLEAFTKSVESAIVNPWGWSKSKREHADPEKLKEQYEADRVRYGYNDLNVDEKKAFDLAWDEAALGNNKAGSVWKNIVKNDPELMMSRTYDARLLELAKKKATGQPISPIAKALQKKPTFAQRVRKVGTPWGPMIDEVAKQQHSKKEQPTAQELRQQNTKEAYERGKKLGYWE